MTNFHYMTGKAYWVKVLGEPVPNYSRDGNEWVFDFTPDADGLKLINELGIKDKLKNKSDEREDFIQLKQKELQANGKANFPITVVDAANKPWDPQMVNGKPTNLIGNGSTVEVKFKVVDYGKGKPTGVYPQAIRVLDHKAYVRQEFAPLPDDSVYLKQYESSFGDEDVVMDGDPLEG